MPPPRTSEQAKLAASGQDLPLDALGSGSDYTAFIDHLGIASLDAGFFGEGEGGDYHSLYDSSNHYSRFGDPGFKYGVALSEAGGPHGAAFRRRRRAAFQLRRLRRHRGRSTWTQLQELTDGMRAHNAEQDKLLAEQRLHPGGGPGPHLRAADSGPARALISTSRRWTTRW